MKCQDILQNELHEKYILNQLENSEKEKYELHLKECTDCQAELENKRILFSGIREAGLAEMKTEIKRQVEIGELNHPGMTWGRLSKIAAVLFIFVLTPGVIIYLSKSNPELVPTAEQETENAPEAIPYSAADAATEGRRDIVSIKLPDADLKVLKIPQQKDAEGDIIFKKNESPKLDALEISFEENKKVKISTEMDEQETPVRAETAQSKIVLQEEVSTFKDEKEDAVLKSNFAATPKESRLKGKTGDLNQPKIEAVIFSSREYKSARTYVYEAPEAGLKKTDQSRQRDKLMFDMRKSTEQTVSDLRFISNGNAILVHLKASEDEAAREILAQTAEVRPPKSFAVEIITQDSLNIEMTWLVGSEFIKMNPEEIKVEILNEQIMRITIENKYIYETELSKNTNAILKE